METMSQELREWARTFSSAAADAHAAGSLSVEPAPLGVYRTEKAVYNLVLLVGEARSPEGDIGVIEDGKLTRYCTEIAITTAFGERCLIGITTEDGVRTSSFSVPGLVESPFGLVAAA
jgi:hypothetical protein